MDFSLPENVNIIINRLKERGFEAYAVGGCVRDLLIGRTPKDCDVTTSALPEQAEECFAGFKVIETGIKHGTVTVVVNGENIEVTTFRKDGEYSDFRRPDNVTFSDKLSDDLARRDFTINAMAYTPETGLVDLYGGRNDLHCGVIACVGDPKKRFAEDALRIMRALRFSSELGFSIEEKTAEAICDMKELLLKIAPERISRELTLLLCGQSPTNVMLSFPDVFAVIVPEIRPCIGFDQHSRYHSRDVWSHISAAVERSIPDPDVRLALLLHDIGKPACFTLDEEGNGHFKGHEKLSAEMAEEILKRLRYSNDTIKRVTTLIRYHYAATLDDMKLVKKMLAAVGKDNFFLLLEVMKGDNLAKQSFCHDRIEVIERMGKRAEELIAENQCLKRSDLAVNGNDMIALGFEGKDIGKVLLTLFDAVLDDTLPNEREILLARAKEELE